MPSSIQEGKDSVADIPVTGKSWRPSWYAVRRRARCALYVLLFWSALSGMGTADIREGKDHRSVQEDFSSTAPACLLPAASSPRVSRSSALKSSRRFSSDCSAMRFIRRLVRWGDDPHVHPGLGCVAQGGVGGHIDDQIL